MKLVSTNIDFCLLQFDALKYFLSVIIYMGGVSNFFFQAHLMQFYENKNISQIMIIRLHVLYNKHKMIKIGNQTGEKWQILSQVLEKFCYRLKEGEVKVRPIIFKKKKKYFMFDIP